MQNKIVLIRNKDTRKFEDKTDGIKQIKEFGDKIAVTFSFGNRTYEYNSSNIRVLKNPKKLDIADKIICIDDFPLESYSHVLDFGEYIKVFNRNQQSIVYHKSKVSFQNSCLGMDRPKSVFGYFKNLSAFVNDRDDGRNILLNQYQRLQRVSNQSVLYKYMSGNEIEKNKNEIVPIYPFGINVSQKEAVKVALENQISIIEGPPGTGKTQTILNIIANLVANGKTVGIVSGNNSATENVQEKLEKNGFGFITALLGNSTKREEFFKNKQIPLPDLSQWKIDDEKFKNQTDQLLKTSQELDSLLEDQNTIARLTEQLSKLKVEQSYFDKGFNGEYIPIKNITFSRKWSADRIIQFIVHMHELLNFNDFNGIKTKINLFVQYGIYKFNYFEQNRNEIIQSLMKDYYRLSIKDLKKRIQQLEARLKNKSYQTLLDEYVKLSSNLFKASLYKKYSKIGRNEYSVRNYKFRFNEFIEEYPVILSTTHSILPSISENFLFDYLIIDEASQVDLVTASLALATCKNIVIVGDVKQLPQIVPSHIEEKSNELFYEKPLNEAYNYSKYSIIASLMKLFDNSIPKTLLSEHYRCHPKIIGFCNEKFYNNELVIMTEDKPEDRPLKIFRTAPGNHARRNNVGEQQGWYNVRQIDVVKDEIIKANLEKYGNCESVGIISPYRMHVTETKRRIPLPKLEVDTVHRFQGREKKTIIFTTVSNDVNEFVDDPNLINVAVSRAVDELIIVTSDKLFKEHGSNIGDLIRYIQYNSMDDAIIQSEKNSVFDLLYSDYSNTLLKYRKTKKNVSKYKSENLMYQIIEEVLKGPDFESFRCVLHIPLNSIVGDISSLTDKERRFALNPWSHVDFLIFNKLDKEPVLAIEVDGVQFHRHDEKQVKRDALKNSILEKINLPLLRVATNESGEKEKLEAALKKVIKLSSS